LKGGALSTEEESKKIFTKRKPLQNNLQYLPIEYVYKMLADSEGINQDQAKSFIQSLVKIIYLVMMNDYYINIPNLGTFYTKTKKGTKKGERQLITSKQFYEKMKNSQTIENAKVKKIGYDEEQDRYYAEYLIDIPDYKFPYFKFIRSIKDTLRYGEKWQK
jgi:nucleoid DNA-binding protein